MNIAGKLLNWTLALTCVSALATERPPDGTKPSAAPQGQTSPSVDNTNINDRDKGGATRTPQNQSNSAENRQLLAAVRRAIVRDKSLSSMAHNVKVLVEGGAVSLRGPVKNEDEKAKVELLAKQVKGVTTIDNQLDVKTSGSSQ
jgi:osmotically-inducible protein OsmY